jgi:hypothetical protein
MSLIMPLKRRVFHQASCFEAAVRCDWRVVSRPRVLLCGVALRFEDERTRDFHDLFERFGEDALRIERPWLSMGIVRVSAAGGVILAMSSLQHTRKFE